MPRSLLVALLLVASLTATVLAQPPATPPKEATPTPTKGTAAVITMDDGGEIRLEFWPGDAPNHVKNFLDLARKGFYDGQKVHRVEPKFVVQFGDPQTKTLPLGDPRIGTGGPGYTVKAEFNKRKHVRGTLAMARSQHPDSAGSQFYITYGATPHLDGSYTVFGQVVTGMEHVDRIKQGDRMQSVAIVEE